jgi:hypothetical protein
MPAPKNAKVMATRRPFHHRTELISHDQHDRRLAGTNPGNVVDSDRERDQKHQSQQRGRHNRSHDCARNAAVGILSLFGEICRGVEADERGESHDHGEH